MSETRRPPDVHPATGERHTPPLQRPITSPSGIQPAPIPQQMGGPTGPFPVQPRHPTPGMGTPVQSGPPPAPGSNPHMTGPGPKPQLPPVARSTGSFSNTGLPRITVQYPQPGSKLNGTRGTYEVRSTLGAGEFGAVYECIGPFDQIYALKMVRPANRPYSEVQAEWAKEQKRLNSLRHPNVVYMYDWFEQGHLFYIALERCDHALKAMLGAPMQEGLVIELARQIFAAVQFLHDNDVVHDDLHAGNVLITHTDRPTVKISDFGISHELRGAQSVRPNVVHHAIMAPEILQTGYTSRQSDLYQCGLLLYWMLMGTPAINMDVPYQELVRQVGDGEPRKRAEMIGTPLGNIIAKMLRRRETFRYSSAKEVWSDMRELPAWKNRQLFPIK